jgi:hypothetical protein
MTIHHRAAGTIPVATAARLLARLGAGDTDLADTLTAIKAAASTASPRVRRRAATSAPSDAEVADALAIVASRR